MDLVVLVAAWLPLLLVLADPERRPAETVFVAGTAVASALLIMRSVGLYLSRLCSIRSIEVRLIARASAYTAIALLLFDRVLFSNMQTFVRTSEVIGGSAVMLALVVLERAAVRSVLRTIRQRGDRARDVLVIGTGAHAADLVALMRDHPDYGTRVVGVLGDRSIAEQHGLASLWRGRIADAEAIAVERRVTGVILSAAAAEHRDIGTIVKRLQRRGIHVQVSNGLAGFDVQRMRQQHLAREPIIYLEPSEPRRRDRLAKRVIDLTIATIVLVLTAPLLVVISLAIVIDDRGPVLFRQTRVGRFGRTFTVYKFRTMVVDAEQRRGDVAAGNERSGPLFKIDTDPRVTRVGRLLRLTSLDEVPQLLNVLRGQMSIVGPRPALPSEVIEFDDELRRRELVPPGITGLWQVEARHEPDFDRWVEHDLIYIDGWTIWLDLKILAKTLPALLAHGGR